MNDLSLSVFTVEIDRVPTYAIQGRKHADAEAILADESVREQLRRLTSGGKPLCDDFSIFRMRIARPDERGKFFKNSDSHLTSDGGLAVLLVELDPPSFA
jgi:hypothetical protein